MTRFGSSQFSRTVPKTLWTKSGKFVIVLTCVFYISLAEMKISQLTLLVLFSSIVFLVGCQNKGSQPSNPFAQNLRTVPPPATFSSQESFLGQVPGSYVPQTPAETFPTSSTQPITHTQPITQSNTVDNNTSGEKATLFNPVATAPTQETGWTPADVAPTSLTAFQAMDQKNNSISSNDNSILAITSGVSESLVVGTSHVVTTITDDSSPTANLVEPSPLYSGRYAE